MLHLQSTHQSVRRPARLVPALLAMLTGLVLAAGALAPTASSEPEPGPAPLRFDADRVFTLPAGRGVEWDLERSGGDDDDVAEITLVSDDLEASIDADAGIVTFERLVSGDYIFALDIRVDGVYRHQEYALTVLAKGEKVSRPKLLTKRKLKPVRAGKFFKRPIRARRAQPAWWGWGPSYERPDGLRFDYPDQFRPGPFVFRGRVAERGTYRYAVRVNTIGGSDKRVYVLKVR